MAGPRTNTDWDPPFGEVVKLGLKVAQIVRLRVSKAISKYEVALLLCVSLYISIFTYFLALKHYVFETYAWDLGSFSQALYASLKGKPFYQTVHLFVLPDGDFFGIHFSPILFLLVPLYAVWTDPMALLFIKTAAVGLAALPLYGLAAKVIGSKKAALLISSLYLLYPPLHGANWFDFQPVSFLPLITFTMQYAYITQRRWLYITSILLGSMTTEYCAVVVALFILFNWLKSFRLCKDLKHVIRETSSKASLSLLLPIFIPIVLLLIGVSVVNSHYYTPEFEEFIRAYSNWRVLGERVDFWSIPLYIIQHPTRALEALLYDYHIKFLYIIILFGSLCFIPFYSVYSLMLIPLMLPFLLSNYRAYYTIGAHYPFYIIPVIFTSLVYSSRNSLLNRKILAVMLLFTISLSPLSPMAYKFIEESGVLWYPPQLRMDEHINSLHKLISLVPENASILTQNHIFPHVSNRLNAYAIPLEDVYFHNTLAAEKYISNLINQSEYILIDLRNVDASTNYVIKSAINQMFNLYACGKESFILKAGEVNRPFFEELIRRRVFAIEELCIGKNARIEFDRELGKKVAYLDKGVQGYVVYGPYTYLPRGIFRTTYLIKVEESDNEGPVLIVDVADKYGSEILGKKVLFNFELKKGKWIEIPIEFSTTEKLRYPVEFRVYSLGKAKVFVGAVAIDMISERAVRDVGQMSFTAMDLKLKEGIVKSGMIIKECGKEADVVWFGPYVSLPAGRYSLRICLMMVPAVTLKNETAIILDLIHDRGTRTVKEVEVNVSLINSLKMENGWLVFDIPFELVNPVNDFEVRGRGASASYEIKLAFIELLPILME